MNATPSPGPKFTLAQLLVTVTVIAVLLAVLAPWLREAMARSDWTLVLLQTVFFPAVLAGLTFGLGIVAVLASGTKAATVFHGLSHGIGSFGGLGMMCTTVPAFEKVFRDFDAALPNVTQTLLATSHTALRYWFVAIPLVVVLVAVDAWAFFLAHRHEPSRGWARLWSGIITVLLVSTWFLSILALFLPLFATVGPLTG